MITHQQEKYSWDFIFMGANIDVAAESSRLGIAAGNAVVYEASPAGTGRMFAQANHMSARLRGGNDKKDR